jgi:hypothetical protein
MLFEVDVQPLASCLSRLVDGHGYEGRADASVTCVLGDHRVLEPGVSQAVPRNVHKPDQAVLVPSDDPPPSCAGGPDPPSSTRSRRRGAFRMLQREARSIRRCRTGSATRM